MAWYDRLLGRQTTEEKLNPAQSFIALEEGLTLDSRETKDNYRSAYEELEVVNRAVNMIVDDVSDIPFEIGDKIKGITPIKDNVRRSRVDLILNKEPNPFQDISNFKRNLIIDLLLDGNIFVYYDGAHLYQLPANNVTIHSHTETYIEKFEYDGHIDYAPREIIHIKELNGTLELHLKLFDNALSPTTPKAHKFELTKIDKDYISFKGISPGAHRTLSYSRPQKDVFYIRFQPHVGNPVEIKLAPK